MSLQVAVQPAFEPITLTEAKAWLRVDLTDDDDLITSLIVAARQYVETRLERAIPRQTLRLTLDHFPGTSPVLAAMAGGYPGVALSGGWAGGGYIERAWANSPADPRVIRLPRPPLASVTTIAYVDANSVTQTLTAGTDYAVDADSEPGRVTPAYGTTWPTARCQPNAVTVTYLAGWVDAASIPAAIKFAVRLILASWYENREAVEPGTLSVVPLAVEALLNANAIPNFF